ncbi:hypothetical protein GCM10010440_76340 [Kitasatospora cinereorecta]
MQPAPTEPPPPAPARPDRPAPARPGTTTLRCLAAAGHDLGQFRAGARRAPGRPISGGVQ